MHVKNEIWILLRLKTGDARLPLPYTFISWQQNCEIIVPQRGDNITTLKLTIQAYFCFTLLGEGVVSK